MKIIRILVVLSLSFISLFSQGTIEINSSKLFDFKSVDTKEKINADNTLSNIRMSEPLPFSVKKDYANSIFLSGYYGIKLNNFKISQDFTGNLNLKPAIAAVNEHTEWYKVEKGKFIRVTGPYVTSYEGKIEGQPGSSVYLNYYDGNIFGFIETEDKEVFSISPDRTNSANLTSAHFISNTSIESEQTDFNPFVCLTEDYAGANNEKEDFYKYGGYDKPLASSKVLQVNLLCEGSYDYYTLMGSNFDYCGTYIASVINQSSKIYQDNINVHLVVSKVVIRTDEASDPYLNDSDLSDKLMTMPSVWNNNNLNRSLVVLFANLMDQPAGTIVAGISMGGTPYVGSLCDEVQGYCALGIRGMYKYPTQNYTWDVNVATHEIGHNFSAPHTHSCYYRPNMIDTCVTRTQPFTVSDACVKTGNAIPRPGTIMSYCHTTNATHSVELEFHARTKPLMRKAAETSGCVSEPSGTFLSLLHPLGDSTYPAGKTMEIRWTSKNVKTLSISYSLDAGSTWTKITASVNASDSIFVWTVPMVQSYTAMVAIQDNGNSNMYDKSLSTFSILKAGITIVNPFKGVRLGQNDLCNIKWQITFDDDVKIEFTSDGGNSWSVMSPSSSLGIMDWVIPTITSENCKIRMTAKTDNTIFSETGLFAIGKQRASITAPKPGDVFCNNEYNDIKWDADFITYMFVEYSTDGGNVWKKVVTKPLDGTIGGYSWKVPSIIAENVLLKLTIKINQDYVDLDSLILPFSIDSCTLGVPMQNENESKLNIIEILPNPVNSDAKVRITNGYGTETLYNLILFNEKGQEIRNLMNGFIPEGTSELNIKINNTANGNYFLILRSKEGESMFPLKIIN